MLALYNYETKVWALQIRSKFMGYNAHFRDGMKCSCFSVRIKAFCYQGKEKGNGMQILRGSKKPSTRLVVDGFLHFTRLLDLLFYDFFRENTPLSIHASDKIQATC